MNSARESTRDISYASSARTRSGRAAIRAIENVTGRLGLLRRARGYQKDIAQGANFWDVMVRRYGLDLEIRGGGLSSLPRTGPLIVVANHPYGILDGLLLGYILSHVRNGEFRLLANSVFRGTEELDRVALPISFDESKEAVTLNLATRKTALAYLASGGAIGVFPGGTVSTSPTPFARPMDPAWRSFTAKLIAKSGATVVPVFFEGSNSRLFQVASHVHTTLRLALLINEFRQRTDGQVGVVIGSPIARSELKARSNDQKAMMDFLRRQTYALSPTRLDDPEYGFEFEAKHRKARAHGRRDTG